MKKIVTLLGDFYHSHDNMLSALEDSLKNALSEYEIIDIDTNQFLLNIGKKPDAVVIGKDNKINPQDQNIRYWMTEEMEKEIVEYVKKGGRLFVWHAGLASYPKNGLYCSMIKGYFEHHPSQNKPVRYYSAKSKILKGKEFDFEIVDEHYFVYCDTQNTEVFLYSESEDGKSIAGWCHQFGDGKVLALTPAHREEGLKNQDMKMLLSEVLKILFEEI